MSKTNIQEKLLKDIEKLIKNRQKIPDEFWVSTAQNKYQAIWFLDRQRPSVSQSYDFDMERFGLTKEGKIIWGFDSGCSCPSPWEDDDRAGYETREYKEFVVEVGAKVAKKKNDDYSYDWLDETWDEESASNLVDYLLLIKKDLKPEDVLTARNAEVRRYLMKRIGYEKIRDMVGATIVHTDGTSQLLRFKDGDMYVKVKDSSTKREYLLYVDPTVKTCRQAIAWTFGLSESEYLPIIET